MKTCWLWIVASCSLPLAGCGADRAQAPALPLSGVLAGPDAAAFEQVTAPRAFEFPADWGAHPEYRTEWWYFTGNATDDQGQHFGFELTFFRFALTPSAADRPSEWRANQVWMAHLAVTDAAGRRFVAEEQLQREALGLAGAVAEPFRVWVGPWSATMPDGDGGPIRLEAQGDAVGVALTVRPEKGVVAQGQDGMDRKGPNPGNASYYYSLPRMALEGRLRVDGTEREVRGLAWVDREWGSSTLAAETAGWDWFGLQLADGRELMFYRLRQRDGGTSEFSGGALIERGGEVARLGAEDVQLETTARWHSDASKASYPVAWRLRAPTAGLDLAITPYVDAQELDLSVRYWEGAVAVSGTASGEPTSGWGYVELTGY